MKAQIIDGKKLSLELKEELAQRVSALKTEKGILPGLAVVLVGDDPASQIYVANKHKLCENVGVYSEIVRLSAQATTEDVIAKVKELNGRADIHGIIIQLPLPGQVDERAALAAVSPQKDVDGLHIMTAGALLTGAPCFEPCTPQGIIRMIKSTGIDIAGKRAVVVGRSNIVGKPVALLLLRENATVTVCHSRTAELPAVCREADILVAAIGKEKFITADFVKPGAIVIDVGINRGADGKVHGDVDFDGVSEIAGYISPVPGGVGPMTVAMLIANTVKAGEMSR